MSDDPFAVLGVEPTASPDELRAARRRRAKELHPDHAGGDAEAMRRVNAALDTALALRAGRGGAGAHRASGGRPGGGRAERAAPAGRVAHDVASFTVEALPAETFEALLVVTSWIGEVVNDDPPYVLEVRLDEPAPCWCRLELVPDAGASTVSLTIAAEPGAALPDIDAVRDMWVAELNRVGRPD